MNDTAKFFLGANSNKGFISYFKQLQEQSDSMQLLILKGGPGSGKSSLMKRVADFAQKKGHTLEIIPCASDPQSLDAVIDKTAHFAIMDGTAPHTEDPGLPGVFHHIAYTGDLWDTKKLNDKKAEIAFFNDLTGEYHSAASAYIKAAGALLEKNISYSKKYVDKEKMMQLAQRLINLLPRGNYSKENTRLLSAVSVGEIKFFEETVPLMADRIFVIEDDWGGVCDSVLKAVRAAAEIRGSSLVHCPCSIIPDKTDHIILPEERIAFCSADKFLKSSFGERIKADELYKIGIDRTAMEKRRADAEKLLVKACALVKEAKKSHDRLEKYYVSAMDFKKMDEVFERIKKNFYN